MRYIDADSIQYASGSIGGVGIANITFKKNIDAVPTADVAPIIHAHWETIYDDCGNYGFVKCTACGDEYGSLTYHYCPNCGAKMNEEVEER